MSFANLFLMTIDNGFDHNINWQIGVLLLLGHGLLF